MADLGTAYVNIVPKAPGIESEVGSMFSGSAMDSVGKAAGSNIGANLKKGLLAGGAAVTAAAVGIGKTIVSSAGELAGYGDNIDKMSQKMGISAKAYQEWDAILQHSGTSIDGMQRGMMTLSSAAANNSDAFEELGISQKKLIKMNQEQLFAEVIKKLQGMEDGSKRTALAQKLLGGAAKELGPLLNTSAEDTEAMRQRVHELGGVLSDDAVKASAAYQDSLQDMKTTFTGLKNTIVSSFLPGLTSIMDGFTALVLGEEGAEEKITAGFESLFTSAETAIDSVFDLAGKLIPQFVEVAIKHLPKLLALGAKLILKIAVGLINAIPSLVAQIPAIWKALKAAWNEVDWKALGSTLMTMLKTGVTTLKESAGDTLAKVGDYLKTKWNNTDWAALGKALIEKVKNGISAVASKVWDGLRVVVSNVKTKFGEVDWKQLGKDMINGIISGLTSAASGLYKKIKDIIKKGLKSGQEEAETGSPSRLFARELGRWIPAGVAMGAEENMEPLDRAMRGMIDGSVASASKYAPAGLAGDGEGDADRIIAALQRLKLGVVVELKGDAGAFLKVINTENFARTTATGYNRLASAPAR